MADPIRNQAPRPYVSTPLLAEQDLGKESPVDTTPQAPKGLSARSAADRISAGTPRRRGHSKSGQHALKSTLAHEALGHGGGHLVELAGHQAAQRIERMAAEQVAKQAGKVLAQRGLAALAQRVGAIAEHAMIPIGALLHLAEGLHAIGAANVAGQKTSELRNEISGYFATLTTALGNPKLPLDKCVRFSANPRWIQDQRAIARSKDPKIPPREREKAGARVKAYEKGQRAVKSLLDRMSGSRAELLSALQEKFGQAALRTLQERALRNAHASH